MGTLSALGITPKFSGCTSPRVNTVGMRSSSPAMSRWNSSEVPRKKENSEPASLSNFATAPSANVSMRVAWSSRMVSRTCMRRSCPVSWRGRITQAPAAKSRASPA